MSSAVAYVITTVILLGVTMGYPLRYRCGPTCMIYCPFGNEINEYGCPTCSCKNGPTSFLGPFGFPFDLCPPFHCNFICFNGYKMDRNGCDICACA